MKSKQPRRHLEYPEVTMFQMIEKITKENEKAIAYEFYGKKTEYQKFLKKIERVAKALLAQGVQKDQAVTICMPNTPQALDCFYAINRIGAVANMVHPLSAQEEITFYLNLSKSSVILTLDMFYEKVKMACQNADHPVCILVTRMQDELPAAFALAYTAKEGRKHLKYPDREEDIVWKKFLKGGDGDVALPECQFDKEKTAVILYSGGTSGTPKGICLSDLNFNALALQAKEAMGDDLEPGHKMLSCMPVFHGFGLGVNIHTALIHGACCILMPSFTGVTYAKMLAKKKPNYIAGVPTIFEALLHIPQLEGVKLDFLMGMFCGGDSLSVELKKKVDAFLKEHGATIQVREGYGLTECVTASCLTPKDSYKEGSIGLPFPDMEFCIVNPGTDEEVPRGELGEIILTGPTLMLKYLDNPEETQQTLRSMPDGRTWLYTGDIGCMDEEGYVYFKQRRKRVIITNGYNVYSTQVENIIDSCPEVSYSCVIGVKDTRRMHKIKAYIVLRDGVVGDEACKKKIMDQLELKIAKYALPREIEFRKELPKTLVGKVAYRKLEEEANAKLN